MSGELLIGGGELGDLVRAHDWARTPLGPREGWPQSLRTVVSLLLGSSFPMALLWGEELTLVYNDAYRVIAAGKHPAALGRSTREVWAEVFHINRPIFDAVMERGESPFFEDLLFPIDRGRGPEEAYFTLSYSPVRVEDGSVGGTLVTLIETTKRKETEARRAPFEAILEAVRDGILVLEPTGRVVLANRAAERLLGSPAGEGVGPDLAAIERRWSFRTLDGRPLAPGETPLARAVRGDFVVDARFEVHHGDGEKRQFVAVTSAPVTEGPGRTDLAVVVLRDVTERVDTERALRTSESLFRSLFEESAVGIVMMGPDQRFIRANRAFASFVGYSEDELGARTILDVTHPEDAARDAAGTAEVIAGKRSGFRAEKRYLRKDGRPVWGAVSATAIRDASETFLHTIAVVEDIDARKRAQAERNEIDERYRLLFETMLQGVVFQDAEGRITHANPAAEAILGLSLDQMQGRQSVDPRWRAIHEDGSDFPGETHPAMEALRTGRPVLGVTQGIFNPATGTHRWINANSMPRFRPGETRPFEVYSTFEDVTERRRAVRELAAEREALAQRVLERTADLSHANAELSRAARAKDEFLANMSHELRTPLNAVLGLSEGLLEQRAGPLTQRQQAMVTAVEQSGRHLLDLINDILDLSRVEAGRLELSLGPVMVCDVCQASLLMVREAALRKGLRLEARCPDQLARVHADERRLKQILVNLLTNAVKFTPEGGSVALEAVADEEAGTVRFTVADTGIGIAEADLPRLFQPFTQVDSSLTRSEEGTGLGLALVRRLAELHGGSIAVESTPGLGSRFTVALPDSQAVPPPDSGLRVAPRTALVVEDSRSAAEQIVRHLRALGVEATVHPSGTGVVEAVRKLRPDVVFLDILMPDRSGWEVLADLRADPETAKVPVVVCSVVDEPARAQAAGAAAHVVKPLRREALERALHAAAEGARQALVVVPREAPGGPRLLLAEDNEANVLTVQGFLEDEGYEVVVARNGREAVDLAKAVTPALVLMDVQMPEVDGLEATRRLRRMPGLERVPIVALTALAMPGDRERCLAAGATEFLTKPVPLRRLAEVVARLLAPDAEVGT